MIQLFRQAIQFFKIVLIFFTSLHHHEVIRIMYTIDVIGNKPKK